MPGVTGGDAQGPGAAGFPANRALSEWLAALAGSDLVIPWVAEDLRLYGNAASLDAGQVGYRVDAAGSRLPGWQDDWLVLGQLSGDPLIARPEGDGCAVLFARHGAGAWQPRVVADAPQGLAAALHVWCDLFLRQYARDIYDDTYAVRPAFLDELRRQVGQVLPAAQADVFLDMVDG